MKNITRISATEFLETFNNNNNLTIVDVRSHAEIETEHLKPCHPLPLQDLDQNSFDALLQKVEQNSQACDQVYLMCQSGKRAEMAVEKLNDNTTCQLIIIEGGMNAVKSAGANIHKGTRNVISLERQVRIAAGVLVMTGVALGYLVNPTFFYLSGFVGAGLTFAGITDTCGMAMVLARLPWNKASSSAKTA